MGKESLLHRLTAYTAEDNLPMHMPGHKRCECFPYLAPLSAGLDITEINGFDDLNHPEEIFLESEKLAASLWGSDECIYSVNGSSGAILAAIRGSLIGKDSKKVILSRGSHKSVYHGVEICGAVPVYLSQEVNEYGFHTSVSPCEVEEKLKCNPDASLVIVTSPTYEGVISDIRQISKICHSFNVPLMVDEAHGAHLGLHGIFPDGAVRCGADVVVQSLHKTLPSLTQTAILHMQGTLCDREEIRRQLAIFQTSSPSYLLTASIDGAVRYLAEGDGKARLETWYHAVCDARYKLKRLKNLKLYEADSPYDPSKLVICGAGKALSAFLRERHRIEIEMTSAAYVIAMSGAGDTEKSLNRFTDGIFEADAVLANEDFALCDARGIGIPTRTMAPFEAIVKESEYIPISDAAGRISAAYVYAYPPGVPVIIPGETIDKAFPRNIGILKNCGITLHGTESGKIKVIKE